MVAPWWVAVGAHVGPSSVERCTFTDAHGVPWGTLGVNLLGSSAWRDDGDAGGGRVGREQALALGTGLLGAFTTMSTFAVEVLRLFDGGERCWLLVT